MADKTVTTCASVLYAIFQKRQQKCSCLCHTNKNKNKLLAAEMNANLFFHCKCSLECHAPKLHCPKCGRAKYFVEKKKKKKKRKAKILKFQIEHTSSNLNLTSSKNNLLCTCELLVPKCSPSLSHIISHKASFNLYSPNTSPGKFSLQDMKTTSKGCQFLHGMNNYVLFISWLVNIYLFKLYSCEKRKLIFIHYYRICFYQA